MSQFCARNDRKISLYLGPCNLAQHEFKVHFLRTCKSIGKPVFLKMQFCLEMHPNSGLKKRSLLNWLRIFL